MNLIPSYRLYGEKDADRPDFWVHCETIPERTHLHNWEIALHRHAQFFQIFHLTQGSGEVVLEDRLERFAGPAMIFVPPGKAHGFRFSRDIDGLVLTALADRLSSLTSADRQILEFASALRIVPMDETADTDTARKAIQSIATELAGRKLGAPLLLESLTTLAVVALARIDRRDALSRQPDRDQDRVEALLDLIETHYRNRPSVAVLAAKLGLSPAHLNRLARAVTGLSIQGLTDRRTLEAARRDLVFTPSPIQAIAYSLGFADPAYFNRFFRRQTGITPGAYRERERGRLSEAEP